MKRYAVKEVFGPTLQGEGRHAGAPVVFLRFAGCNAWSGHPDTKASSLCPFCDTDFIGGALMTADEIHDAISEKTHGWVRAVVVSGGEPLLQLDGDLARVLSRSWSLWVETNGLVQLDHGVRDAVEWVACSPKRPPDEIKIPIGDVDEFKVLWPHPDPALTPLAFDSWLGAWHGSRYVQPIEDGASDYGDQMRECRDALVEMMASLVGAWQVSLQAHKVLGVE